jgi:hypothetical protein
VRFDDAQGEVVSVHGAIACELPETSVFGSLTEVSQYFRQASVGYSCGADGRLHGVGFCTDSWKVEPFGVVQARSRLIEGWFGEAEATFDHALIMRDVPATWLSATA